MGHFQNFAPTFLFVYKYKKLQSVNLDYSRLTDCSFLITFFVYYELSYLSLKFLIGRSSDVSRLNVWESQAGDSELK